MVAVVVVIVVAAVVAASRTSTRTSTRTTSPSSADSLPDFTVDGSAGSITSDAVTPGDVAPTATPGLDVHYLSYRDPAQGFAGPQLYVQLVRDTDPNDANSIAYGDAGAESVDVHGRAGRLTVLGTVVLLGIPPPAGGDTGMLFVGYQLSEPQVLAAAESLVQGDQTLPSLTPLTLATSGVDTAPSEGARTIAIHGDADYTLSVHGGDAATFEGVVRDRVAGASFAKTTTVTGIVAVLVADSAGTTRTVLWQPTPDTVAELQATASEAQILRVAAALHRR